MATKNIYPWIVEAEGLIRSGNGSVVRNKLHVLQKNGVPKDMVLECAVIAKRVGMYQFGANILFREINDPVKVANPKLLAEYATCIAGIGQYREAEKIFSELPESIIKHYAIQYADLLFRNWNYNLAKQILVKHQPEEFQSYQDLVFGLNLVSAYIQCRDFDQASDLIKILDLVAQHNSCNMIGANLLELSGKIFFHRADYLQAHSNFKKSEELLRETKNLSWLFAYKWMNFTNVFLLPGQKSNLDGLNSVRAEARKFLHWESLREADLFDSIQTTNSKLFNRVFFGTPNEFFRNMALRISDNQFDLNSQVDIGPRSDQENIPILNMVNLTCENIDFELNWSTYNKRLVKSLTQDLYRPVNIFQMHQDIFEEKYYDPESSKAKTYKVIQKFRKLITTTPLGLTIENRRGYGYRLRANRPIRFLYPQQANQKINSPEQIIADNLEKNFGSQEFSRQEFCQLNNKSHRTAIRILNGLEEQGLVEKIGKGPKTRYRLNYSKTG